MENKTTATKYLLEIGEAIEAAQAIGRDLKTLHTQYADGKIDEATFGAKLETLHRQDANQLKAMIANLGYAVRP